MYNFKSMTNLTMRKNNDEPNQVSKYFSTTNLRLSEEIENKPYRYKKSLSEQELKHRIKQISNQALCSSQRMLNYCNQSENIGTNTARLLEEQDNKLRRVENDLDQMDSELKNVEKNLKKLKKSKFCLSFIVFLEILAELLSCCCCCFCLKQKTREKDSLEKKKQLSLFGRFFKSKKSNSKSNTDISINNNRQLAMLLDSDFSDIESSNSSRFTAKSESKTSNLKRFFSNLGLRKVDSNISSNFEKKIP